MATLPCASCTCVASAIGSCAFADDYRDCACATSAQFLSQLGACVGQEPSCVGCVLGLSAGYEEGWTCPPTSFPTTSGFTTSVPGGTITPIPTSSITTSPQTSNPNTPGLSVGAKVGLGVGIAGFALVVTGGFLVWKHFHVAKAHVHGNTSETAQADSEKQASNTDSPRTNGEEVNHTEEGESNPHHPPHLPPRILRKLFRRQRAEDEEQERQTT